MDIIKRLNGIKSILMQYKELEFEHRQEYIKTIDEAVKELEKIQWIPCEEKMPEERDSMFAKFHGTEKWKTGMFKTRSSEVITTVAFEDGSRLVKPLTTQDGEWREDIIIKSHNGKVISWMPMPEPFKGDVQ